MTKPKFWCYRDPKEIKAQVIQGDWIQIMATCPTEEIANLIVDALLLADARKALAEQAEESYKPSLFVEPSYDAMMAVQGQIVNELERAGFDPCPAIKIAGDATAKAWDIWSGFEGVLHKYDNALRNISLLTRRQLRRTSRASLEVPAADVIEHLSHIQRFCEAAGIK